MEKYQTIYGKMSELGLSVGSIIAILLALLVPIIVANSSEIKKNNKSYIKNPNMNILNLLALIPKVTFVLILIEISIADLMTNNIILIVISNFFFIIVVVVTDIYVWKSIRNDIHELPEIFKGKLKFKYFIYTYLVLISISSLGFISVYIVGLVNYIITQYGINFSMSLYIYFMSIISLIGGIPYIIFIFYSEIKSRFLKANKVEITFLSDAKMSKKYVDYENIFFQGNFINIKESDKVVELIPTSNIKNIKIFYEEK